MLKIMTAFVAACAVLGALTLSAAPADAGTNCRTTCYGNTCNTHCW